MNPRSLLCGLVALMLAACGDGATRSAGRTRISVQLNWVPEPEFGGLYAAEQDGLFRDAGLDVEIIRSTGGTAVPQLVAQGVCDVGVVSGDQILTLREQGGDLVAVFNVFDGSPYGFMVHAAGAPATLEAMWKGTGKVACESGLPVIRFIEATYGPSARQVVPWGGNLAAFQGDPAMAAQCFITAEPVQMDLAKVPVKVLSLAEAGYDPYTVVMAVKPGRMSVDALRKFVAVNQEGWKRYLADPAKYNPGIAALNPAMSLEAMNLAAERMKPLLLTPWTREHGLGSMDPARWKAMSDTLQRLGVLKRAHEPAEVMAWPGPDAS
jgi:NitT/TauT family transport system substrate-binding protein